MYYDYFGFKQPPFKITPDTNLFFPGGDRGAILEALIYAILNGEGIVKVVGEVGSGKTMLCRMLEKELPDKVDIVYLANPRLSPENTLHAIAFELKLPINTETSRLQVMNDLQQYLVERHAQDRQVVVFVEEAQGMPLGTLEEIRLLSNLETQQNKLLQIVLFGQPELDEMIATPEIRQLKERITYSFQLKPFKTNDIRDYITTRLRACGYRTGELFSPAAITEIERYSQGLVRRINILADKSLLAAYAATCQIVTDKHVSQAARDSEFTSDIKPKWRPYLLGACALTLILGLVLWAIYDRETPGTTLPAPEITAPDEPFKSSVQGIKDGNNETSTVAVESTVKPEENLVESTGNAQESIEITNSYSGVYASLGEREEERDDTSIVTEQMLNEQLDQTGKDDPGEKPDEPVLTGVVEDADLKKQLLGMSAVYQLQDLGDSSLTDRDSYILRKQLQVLPPEVSFSNDKSLTDDTCQLCWSIIYRPLIDPENL